MKQHLVVNLVKGFSNVNESDHSGSPEFNAHFEPGIVRRASWSDPYKTRTVSVSKAYLSEGNYRAVYVPLSSAIFEKFMCHL